MAFANEIPLSDFSFPVFCGGECGEVVFNNDVIKVPQIGTL